MSTQIDKMSVNAIRVLAADAVQKANSGHPGLPLGCAAIGYELWGRHMKHNPANPKCLTETVSFFREATAQHFCIHYFIFLDTD